MRKKVYCDKYKREITIRGDLVTTLIFFEVVPYHEDCYAKDLKGLKTLIVSNEPINGFVGTLLAVLSLFITIYIFFHTEGMLKIASFLPMIPVGYRMYSYLVYEKHLEI